MINVFKYFKSSHEKEGLDQNCIIYKEETRLKGLQGSRKMATLRVKSSDELPISGSIQKDLRPKCMML